MKHLQKEVARLEAELRTPEPSSSSLCLRSLLREKDLKIQQVIMLAFYCLMKKLGLHSRDIEPIIYYIIFLFRHKDYILVSVIKICISAKYLEARYVFPELYFWWVVDIDTGFS